MAQNPLFPTNDQSEPHQTNLILSKSQPQLTPLTDAEKASIAANPAADLIREKLDRIYRMEPDARAEEREAEAARHRSRHQQFMYDLSTSGRSLADIQVAWHEYYVNLPNDQKHEVWQEFYANNQAQPSLPERSEPAPQHAREIITQHAAQAQGQRAVVSQHMAEPQLSYERPKRRPSVVRQKIRHQVQKRTANMSTNTRHNLHSLGFGLASGFIILLIFLFGFFNEVMIAPFIQPGRGSAAPVIVTTSSVDATSPSIIIPKINVQIPVVYDLPDGSEATVENGLENGVVHYPTTKLPGQMGNAAFFGHSSNNIFNKGKYKFAFVLLHKMKEGDTFYLTYGGQVYGYKVISTKIVSPSQVDVLYDIPGQTATATLMTCDPPGTSLNRLIVVGQQVSPDPANNVAGTTFDQASSGELPSNGPTLWTLMWRAIF
jgi:sortase A